jgi:hypothetical protein
MMSAVTTTAELADVSATIHDDYFDLGRLDHRADQDELRLPIYPARSTKRWLGWTSRPPQEPLPPPLGVLVVRNVLGISVEDEAAIGWYDVNRLEYESASGVLRIVANAPCTVEVRCRNLDVELLRRTQQ